LRLRESVLLAGQLRGQARDRDLPLVVLAQNEALEVRPKMVLTPLGSGATTVSPDGAPEVSGQLD
jgi:hypothetical protein